MSRNMPRSSFLSIYKVGESGTFLHNWLFFCVCLCDNDFWVPGDAESGLERLHQCAEKEFQGYLNSEGPSQEFNEFRTKLAGLTR